MDTPINTVSPELVLVDPVLADLERADVAHRLDGWWARTEQRPSRQVTTSWGTRRQTLFAVLLASVLVNGVLTAFLLFGHRPSASLQPAATPPTQTATVAGGAAQVINIAPPPPSGLRRAQSK